MKNETRVGPTREGSIRACSCGWGVRIRTAARAGAASHHQVTSSILFFDFLIIYEECHWNTAKEIPLDFGLEINY